MEVKREHNNEKEEKRDAAFSRKSYNWVDDYQTECNYDDMPPAYTEADVEHTCELGRPPSYRENGRPKTEKDSGEACAISGYTASVNWVRRWLPEDTDECDVEDVELSDDCPTTYEGDRGYPFSKGYIVELEEEFYEACERLEEAKRKRQPFRVLYWKSRGEYYLSHLEFMGLTDFQDGLRPPADYVARKIADDEQWHNLHLGEHHLRSLDEEVDEAMEDVSMVESEMALCRIEVGKQPSQTWRFDHGQGLHIWVPNEGKSCGADEFRRLPEHQRVLIYEGTRYN
ncbi:hypothetical protein JX266_008396 [Neoarthrinium moseri]|nr:hypothetical protein JX266_008396 [Neoarthrinium moseri]